ARPGRQARAQGGVSLRTTAVRRGAEIGGPCRKLPWACSTRSGNCSDPSPKCANRAKGGQGGRRLGRAEASVSGGTGKLGRSCGSTRQPFLFVEDYAPIGANENDGRAARAVVDEGHVADKDRR